MECVLISPAVFCDQVNLNLMFDTHGTRGDCRMGRLGSPALISLRELGNGIIARYLVLFPDLPTQNEGRVEWVSSLELERWCS